MLFGRQSYNGLTFSPLSTATLNIGSYTLRNCSGLTLALTIASISASDGQRSLSVIGLPLLSVPKASFSMSKRIVPAMA